MQIEFHLLVSAARGVTLLLRAEGLSDVELGDFDTEAAAMQALAAALTTIIPEPPDLSRYDEAVENVGSLAARLEESEDAIRILSGDVEGLTETVMAITPAPAPVASTERRPLLAGRQAAAVPAPARTAAVRPTLRKPQPPRTNELPEDQQSLGARVHGQLFGGPMRGRHGAMPGQAQPPTAPDEE